MSRTCTIHIGEDVTCFKDAVRAFLTWFDPGADRVWNRVLTDKEVQNIYNAADDAAHWRVEYVCEDHSSEFWHVAEFDPSAARELTLKEGLVAEVMCF